MDGKRIMKRSWMCGRHAAGCVLSAVILMTLVLLSGCIRQEAPITSLSQLNEKGRIIAVSDGAPEEVQVRKDFPNATIQPFTDMVAAYTSVASGKADACIHSRRELSMAIENDVDGVHLLDVTYCENPVAVGISKATTIPDLKGKIDTFLQQMREDGTLDDLYERWVINVDENMPDFPKPENPERTLYVGTTGTIMPYSYYIGDQLAGYDIELAKRFAAWLGMDVEFRIYSFGGIIAAAQSSEVDCIMSNLYYTKEHEEAIDFSVPIFSEEVTAMVRDSDSSAGLIAEGERWWESIVSSFEKTFLRENRWKLLLRGAGVTLFITASSILLGTLLGFLVYLLCRKGNRAANLITRFCVWLVQGMPVAVFLMILYYIVFSRLMISNTIVSVIGFTLIFGAAVYSMLKTGIAALDRGQKEASYALGFSDRQTFYLVMLPQALPNNLEPFIEQVTALIKATSIVGYIAVQDLTKMGDIIRSRTYEAFFPLITVAVIYFMMGGILIRLIRWIGSLLDSRQRRKKNLLKGVKRHD